MKIQHILRKIFLIILCFHSLQTNVEAIQLIPKPYSTYSFPKISKYNYCKVKYNLTNKKLSKINCILTPPKISFSSQDIFDRYYWITTYGSVQRKLLLNVERYRCKRFSFWDIRTWFTCVNQKIGNKIYLINTGRQLFLKAGSKFVNPYKHIENSSGNFNLNHGFTRSFNRKTMYIVQIIRFSKQIDKNRWIDYYDQISGFTIVKAVAKKRKVAPRMPPPLFFPLQRIAGVTQWHGNTTYQKPHTGIDFAVVKKRVISPGSGKIVFAGWDKFYGK